MSNKIVLSSLTLDLKRIALGLHKKSYRLADRFNQEAIQRQTEVKSEELPIYLQQVLSKVKESLSLDNNEKKAEDLLMYSTIIQNYVVYKMKIV